MQRTNPLLVEVLNYPNRVVEKDYKDQIEAKNSNPKRKTAIPLYDLNKQYHTRIFQLNSINDLNDPDAKLMMQENIDKFYALFIKIKQDKKSFPLTNSNILSIIDRFLPLLKNALKEIQAAIEDTDSEWQDIQKKFTEIKLNLFKNNLCKTYLFGINKIAREGEGFGTSDSKKGKILDDNANDLASLVSLIANNTIDLLSKDASSAEILSCLKQKANPNDEDYTPQLKQLFDKINENSFNHSKSKIEFFKKRKSSSNLSSSGTISKSSKSDSDSNAQNSKIESEIKSTADLNKKMNSPKTNFTIKSIKEDEKMSSSRPSSVAMKENASSEALVKFDEATLADSTKLSRSGSISITETSPRMKRSNSERLLSRSSSRDFSPRFGITSNIENEKEKIPTNSVVIDKIELKEVKKVSEPKLFKYVDKSKTSKEKIHKTETNKKHSKK